MNQHTQDRSVESNMKRDNTMHIYIYICIYIYIVVNIKLNNIIQVLCPLTQYIYIYKIIYQMGIQWWTEIFRTSELDGLVDSLFPCCWACWAPDECEPSRHHQVRSGYGLCGFFLAGNEHVLIGTKAGKWRWRGNSCVKSQGDWWGVSLHAFPMTLSSWWCTNV